MNFIGDVAGRYDELLKLLEKMPKEPTYLIGDLMDRGPKSKEVIEFVINTPDIFALKGNHEEMMIDYYKNTKIYGEGVWFQNGGNETMKSYGCKLYNKPSAQERIISYIPKEHIDFLDNLPLVYKEEGLLVTHAPQVNLETIDLWNRDVQHIEGVVQIFGHNSQLKQYGVPPWAYCIDNCSRKELVGINWPSKQLYIQEYLS